MGYRFRQVGHSYGFWVPTVRYLLERVRADVSQIWEPDDVRNICSSFQHFVIIDDARLNNHKKVIADLKSMKFLYPWTLRRANLTLDVDSVLANKTKIRAFLHCKI